MEPRTQQTPGIRLTPHLMFGLMIILVGVVFTLDNLNIAHAEDYLRFWPLGLIAIGLAKIWQDRQEQGSPIGGILFTLVGSWLMLDTFGYVDANLFDFWPMLLVFVGGMIVWHGIRGRRERSTAAESDTINAVAVLSGVNRGSNSTSFKGGELTAFMGGCEVDLRNASINGDAAIDVFAMWGGIEIRVPESWTVIGKVTPLMGGFEDQTRAPQAATAHRLTVRGMVIMGGVEIKN
jgi:predicted membrane protein